MRRLGLIILANILLFSLPVMGAAFYGNIPQTTLQIARDTTGQYTNSPHSKIVRVGIGSQSFSTYEWDKASIYGTGEFEVYNNKTYINTYDNDNYINISMVGKIFVLTGADGNAIAKVSGPIIFKSDYGFLGVQNLKRAGKDAIYRGQIELVPSSHEGKFYIVNSLYLEDYLKGVVPNEMPVSFGLEALKAQSIAARNYVLSPRVKANPNYDVVDSVASQVYFGANTERDLSNRAVDETAGIVATYDWDLILAQYSSTAGGYSESYQNAFSDPYTKKFPATPKPYLKAQPDREEFEPLYSDEAAEKFYKSKPKSFDINSSYYRWERDWDRQELQSAIQSNIANQSDTGFIIPAVKHGETIGLIKGLKVLQRGESGKIMKLEIQTDKGNYVAEKELVIRRLLTNKGKALPSANMVFEQEYNDCGELIHVKAYGGGFGHGVGMSQYGAGYMATTLKLPYDKILQHYYTGISLTTQPFILSSNSEQNRIEQSFYAKDKKATLIVDNKYKVTYIDTNINGNDEKIRLDIAQRYNRIDLSKYLKSGLNNIKFFYPTEAGSNKGLRMYIELVGKDE